MTPKNEANNSVSNNETMITREVARNNKHRAYYIHVAKLNTVRIAANSFVDTTKSKMPNATGSCWYQLNGGIRDNNLLLIFH